jgi:hypothetical protein
LSIAQSSKGVVVSFFEKPIKLFVRTSGPRELPHYWALHLFRQQAWAGRVNADGRIQPSKNTKLKQMDGMKRAQLRALKLGYSFSARLSSTAELIDWVQLVSLWRPSVVQYSPFVNVAQAVDAYTFEVTQWARLKNWSAQDIAVIEGTPRAVAS